MQPSQTTETIPPPLDCWLGPNFTPHSDRWRLVLWGFIGLGLLLRLTRYLLDTPLWGDECFLAASFIHRDFAGLLEPLEYNMVAPPLFLWAELAAVRLLGYSELSLRLVPTVASLASVLLFWGLARRWLAGYALVFAVAIFAVAYYPIRHGNEVKPYATDLFAALVLLNLASQWLREPQRARWLYVLGLATGLAVLGSFTAVFVAGGLALALAYPVFRTHDKRIWLAFVVFGLCLAGSFAALYSVTVHTQAASYDAAGLKSLWNRDFPPLSTPLALVPWLLERHTSHLLAYPVGGANYASSLTTLLVLIASIVVWRRGSKILLAFCWLPLAACLAAAALERYPYGGSARTMQFIAPAVCLLAGLGLAQLVAWMRRPVERKWGLVAGVACLLAIGGGTFVRDVAAPYKMIYDQRSREFARWFWREQARNAELVCVKRDLDMVFDPVHWTYDRTAVYQCSQQIYSARHRQGAEPDWNAVSREHPLRCVFYNEHPQDQPEFQTWLANMLARYELREQREYLVNPDVVVRNAPYEDRYVVYEFVPQLPQPPAPGYRPWPMDSAPEQPATAARRSSATR